ncbi:hypothetical protein EON66_10145 [archaeon]|nr:MAG: hypothetical protein EON66_10145 [archaeon]
MARCTQYVLCACVAQPRGRVYVHVPYARRVSLHARSVWSKRCSTSDNERTLAVRCCPPHAAVDFYNEVSLLYGTVSDFCTAETCPTMSAGPKYVCRAVAARRHRHSNYDRDSRTYSLRAREPSVCMEHTERVCVCVCVCVCARARVRTGMSTCGRMA